MQKQYKKARAKLCKFFWACIILVFIVNIILPDKKISSLENRSLAQFPEQFNMDFLKEFNNYYSDQFVGRNALIHLNYLVQKASGVREIQGVYLGKNQLIEDAASVNEEQLQRNLAAINAFAQSNNGCNIQFMLVPNAISVQSDNLPFASSPLDQNKQMDEIYKSLDSSIKKVDPRLILSKHKDENIYYKSDHHWTSLGAYYGAKALNKNIKKADYDLKYVSNSFQGTLASKTGSLNIKDNIEIYPPKNEDYIVTYNADMKTSRSIYSSKALNQKDQYQVFFGGNQGMINISVNNDSKKRLLLIKDSYANSLVQFLLPYYRTITIIDPRYYFDDLKQQMDNDLTTDILFVYNCNTFVQDTSLADCIQIN